MRRRSKLRRGHTRFARVTPGARCVPQSVASLPPCGTSIARGQPSTGRARLSRAHGASRRERPAPFEVPEDRRSSVPREIEDFAQSHPTAYRILSPPQPPPSRTLGRPPEDVAPLVFRAFVRFAHEDLARYAAARASVGASSDGVRLAPLGSPPKRAPPHFRSLYRLPEQMDGWDWKGPTSRSGPDDVSTARRERQRQTEERNESRPVEREGASKLLVAVTPSPRSATHRGRPTPRTAIVRLRYRRRGAR